MPDRVVAEVNAATGRTRHRLARQLGSRPVCGRNLCARSLRLRHCRIEQARAVQVANQAARVRQLGGRLHVGNSLPPSVFSSAKSRVRAKCGSSGLMAASMSASAKLPSRWCSNGCGCTLPSTAAPPPSQR